LLGLQTCSQEVMCSTAGYFSLRNDSRQVVHTRASVTKQCDSVPVRMAAMSCISDGNYGSGIKLAIHFHRLSGELAYGSVREMSTLPVLTSSMALSIFIIICSPYLTKLSSV